MQCPVCLYVRREWLCPSCVTQQVVHKRAAASASWAAAAALEQQAALQATREVERAERGHTRERRRWRLEQMQDLVQKEKEQVQEARARVASLRVSLQLQDTLVEDARGLLQQRRADFNTPADTVAKHVAELKAQREQRRAAQKAAAAEAARAAAAAAANGGAAASGAAAGALAASSSDAAVSPATPPQAPPPQKSSSAAAVASPAVSLGWQRSPLYTGYLRRDLHALQAQLAATRHVLVRKLLATIPLERAKPNSCSIVGLELSDDPEEMIHAKPPLIPQGNPGQADSPIHGNGAMKPAVPLPAREMDAEVVAAALGYLVLLLQLLSAYVGVRLPFPLSFSGSRSHVQFEFDQSRYFLTLMDNSNPQHFRRALSLLDYDIDYASYDFRAMLQESARLVQLGGDDAPQRLGAPLQLLPNTLKLVEVVLRALRKQAMEPYVDHDVRMQRLQAEQKRVSEEQQRLLLEQQQRLFRTPQQRTQAQAKPAAPDRRTLSSSPLLMDASMTQSMVHVQHRPDASAMYGNGMPPPLHPSPARTQRASGQPRATGAPASPAGSKPPALHHLDRAFAAAAGFAPSNTRPTPPGAASPASVQAGASPALPTREAPAAQPTWGASVGGSSRSSSVSNSSNSSGGGDSSGSGGGSSSGSASISGLSSLSSEDLLTPSTFFGLPPNGYMVTEEPRESVLLMRPQDKYQQQQTTSSQPPRAQAMQPQQPQRKVITGPSQAVQTVQAMHPQHQQPQQSRVGTVDLSPSTVMPSPPPLFQPVGMGVAEVAAMTAAHSLRAQSSVVPAPHPTAPVLASAAATAAGMPRFRPGANAIADGHFAAPLIHPAAPGVAVVPILPNAAAQFAQLDPSHPLHPSHHMLQSPTSPSAARKAAAATSATSLQPASYRSASSPLNALGYASVAAAQAGAVLSTLGSHTSNWLLGDLLSRGGSGESSTQAVRQQLAAVSYVSEEDPAWDLIDSTAPAPQQPQQPLPASPH